MTGLMRFSGLLVVAAMLGLGCGDSSSSSSAAATEYKGTQSPGDYWTWSLGSTTFTAVNNTTGNNYSGTLASLNSKFKMLVVTATDDSALQTAMAQSVTNSVGYAVEIPGLALVVKPAGNDENVIICGAKGDCLPAATYDFNWVIIPSQNYTSGQEATGTAVVTFTASTVDALVKGYSLSGTPTGTNAETGMSCASGEISLSGQTPGQNETFFISPSGVFVNDQGSNPSGNAGGFIGFQQPSANVDLSDLAASGREFRGVLFQLDWTGVEDTQLVYMAGNGSALTGGTFTDIEAVSGGKGPVEVTINLTGQPNPGLIGGSVVDSQATHAMVFMVNKMTDSNGVTRYFGFGFGEDANTSKPFNVLFVETP